MPKINQNSTKYCPICSNKEIRTNFKCTGLYQTAPAPMLMGSCNMKQAGTQDFWVLNWNCTVTGTGKENCKGNAIGGTGRFKNVTGSMEWTDIAGFGEGKVGALLQPAETADKDGHTCCTCAGTGTCT